MGGGGDQPAAMEGGRFRHLGGTEEAWRQAFDRGTGHTVLGVLMRRMLDRATVQRAVDAVLRENPRARSELLVPVVPHPHSDRGHGQEQRSAGDVHEGRHEERHEGPQQRCQDDELRLLDKHPERPLLRVPEVGFVRVHLASGWEPRDSLEQLAPQMQSPSEARPEEARAAASEQVSRGLERTKPAAVWPNLDTCFEIGRRADSYAAPQEAQRRSACSCGCGCGGGSSALEGQGEGRTVHHAPGNLVPGEDGSKGEDAGRAGSEGTGPADAAALPNGTVGAQGTGVADDAELPTETKTDADPLRCAGVCCCGVRSGRYKLSMCQDKWLQIVEAAMNDPWEDDPEEEEDTESQGLEGQGPSEAPDSSPSAQSGTALLQLGSRQYRRMKLLKVTLHRLPPAHSLVLMCVHTMACDRVSAALLMEEILKALKRQAAMQEGVKSEAPGGAEEHLDSGCADEDECFYDCDPASAASWPLEDTAEEQPEAQELAGQTLDNGKQTLEDDKQAEEEGARQRRLNLKSVEDCIPQKMSRKPIWAHGIDVLGYGLGSRRHAYLPFREPVEQRRSQLIRSGLSRPDTDTLLEACKRERSSLHGLLSAAVLKAAAQSKALGSRGEHFGVTTLLDLRPMLEDSLHPRTMGFYHSALMNTHQVSEETELWDLARRCHDSVAHAVTKRKQFTDMGDLLMLMGQAMQHPNLTPAGSLRTSLLSIFKDTLHENMDDFVRALDVEDYIGCSSVHGVGPCIAVFDSIREDGLHMANVYPAPLFSRSQMRRLVIHAMELLHGAIAAERS